MVVDRIILRSSSDTLIKALALRALFNQICWSENSPPHKGTIDTRLMRQLESPYLIKKRKAKEDERRPQSLRSLEDKRDCCIAALHNVPEDDKAQAVGAEGDSWRAAVLFGE
ncbi:hypothetical protein SRHO_G00017780 [Serrasalmus rhombeus]